MARRATLLFLLFTFLTASIAPRAVCQPPVLRLDFHHRYSERVRSWAERMSWDIGSWPERGTVAYYSSLLQQDRTAIRGRGLAEASDLTFADGNFTVRIDHLGFLHYSFVSLGTPNVTFLVALDTGSDLFWVPCDCNSCAPTSGDNYGFNNIIFNYFSSKASSTSKKIPCSSSLCDLQTSCSSPSDVCSYEVKYVSANTSSSGFLLEDVLYLTTDDTQQKPTETRITFGCGQTQTGAFLKSGGFNGLLGLGRDRISVPSLLAHSGLTANSFSMCFGPDGSGRISFGDKGHSDQESTPINNNTEHSTYDVSVSGMMVGNKLLNTSFSAIFDSGTSFTILADPAYTLFTQAFDSLVSLPRGPSIPELSIEYCYRASSVAGFPPVKLIMRGGSGFPILRPVIHVKIQDLLTSDDLYCLAVMKSNRLNIIGQNFMTGLKVVFDREKLVIGWKEFDCYNVEDSKPLPRNPPNATNPPSSNTSFSEDPGRRNTVSSGILRASLQRAFMLLYLLVLLVIHLL